MKILQKVSDSSFEKFLGRAKEINTEEEYTKLRRSVSSTKYSDIELGIPPLHGITEVTVYKYFSTKMNNYLFLIEVPFTNYVDDYCVDCLIVEGEPTKEALLNMLMEYKEVDNGSVF